MTDRLSHSPREVSTHLRPVADDLRVMSPTTERVGFEPSEKESGRLHCNHPKLSYVNSEVAAIGASIASGLLGVAPAAWPVPTVGLMAF